MLYSKSTRGFYDPAMHSVIPDDAVAVPDDIYRNLLAAQSAGMIITPDQWGNPTAAPASSLLTLPQARAEQIAQLGLACRAAILGGFVSSALGTERGYGSQATDQQNLVDAVTASQSPNLPEGWTVKLWCSASGAWAFLDHTAAQVQQVHSDWIAFRAALQQKLATFTASVNSASTVPSVQSVIWN